MKKPELKEYRAVTPNPVTPGRTPSVQKLRPPRDFGEWNLSQTPAPHRRSGGEHTDPGRGLPCGAGWQGRAPEGSRAAFRGRSLLAAFLARPRDCSRTRSAAPVGRQPAESAGSRRPLAACGGSPPRPQPAEPKLSVFTQWKWNVLQDETERKLRF